MNHKRGGHPVHFGFGCSLDHVGDRRTDCVPQTMFELGYLNKASAKHLFEKVGCNGVRGAVVLDILDARYGGYTHHFTPRGLSVEQLQGYLSPRMSTFGGYNVGGESDPYGTWHAVTVFHSNGDIGYIDGQCNRYKYATYRFTPKELETLSIAYETENGQPKHVNEVTPQMIDEILEARRAVEAEASARYSASVTEALRRAHDIQVAKAEVKPTRRLSGWAQAAQLSKAAVRPTPKSPIQALDPRNTARSRRRQQSKESEAAARRASRRTTEYVTPNNRPTDPRTRRVIPRPK